MTVLARRQILTLAICLMTLAVSSLSLSGCNRGKKVESTYGPAQEWVEDMRDRIQKKIDDPEKVTSLLKVVDNIERMIESQDAVVQKYYADLRELDQDYHSTRKEFQTLIDAFNTSRYVSLEKMLVYVSEMKRIAEREDWKHVADIDKTLYESWQRPLSN